MSGFWVYISNFQWTYIIYILHHLSMIIIVNSISNIHLVREVPIDLESINWNLYLVTWSQPENTELRYWMCMYALQTYVMYLKITQDLQVKAN